MPADFDTAFNAERARYYRSAGGGISMPVAGALYWLVLGLLGFVLGPRIWAITAFFGSGLLVPVGFALARPLGADLAARSPFAGVFGPAFLSMMLSWPITLAAFATAPELVPLCLAIGMSLHWPVIGWMYGRAGPFSTHALVRAAAVSAIWALLPEGRYTALPLAVALIYLVTVLWIARDRRRALVTAAARGQ